MTTKKSEPRIWVRSSSLSRRSFLLLGSAAALSLGMPLRALAKTSSLKANYYDDFAPNSFLRPDGTVTGVFIDMLDELFHRRLGIAVTHRGMPWARAQQEIKDGQADVFCTLISPARKEYVDFSRESLLVADNVVVFSKRNPRAAEIKKIATRDDLKKFTVGSYIGDSRVDTLFKGINVDLLPDMTRVLMKIEASRTDITVISELRWKYYAQVAGLRDKLDSVLFAGDPPVSFHVGIRKSHPEASKIIDAVDRTVVQMRKDGTLERIIVRYTGDIR